MRVKLQVFPVFPIIKKAGRKKNIGGGGQIGHPNRDKLRKRKREGEKQVKMKNEYGFVDKTPWNAIKRVISSSSEIRY